jgi:hypothetical protein
LENDMKRSIVVGILVAAVGLMAGSVPAQEPTPAKPMMGGAMMDGCKEMMAAHQAMKAEMASMDARLDSLVTAMNAAGGAAKVDATAAVVNELVAQRKAMRDRMMAMGPRMMRHMMHHGRPGMAEGMKPMDCPMMQAPPEGGEKHH